MLSTAISIPEPDATQLDFASAYEKIEETARKLGELVSADGLTHELAAEVVRSEGHLWMFGMGLATGAKPLECWEQLTKQLRDTPVNEQRIDVFRGFLSGLSQKSPQLTEEMLDAAMNEGTLSTYYPFLQAAVGVYGRGVDRLLHSLRLGRAPINAYQSLGGGRAIEHVTGADVRRLIGEIASRPEGFDVAVEILGMRIRSEREKKTTPDPELLRAGRELIRGIPLDSNGARQDYHVGEIVKFSFIGDEGLTAAYEISSKLRELTLNRTAFSFVHDHLLKALLSVQPAATLDGLFVANQDGRVGSGLEKYAFWDRRNPFDAVPEQELLRWCDADPTNRYPLIAAVVNIYASPQGATAPAWSSIALRLLERAPDRIEVMKRFTLKFEPSGWTGSHAATIEANAKLLDQLAFANDSTLDQFVAEEKVRFHRLVEEERQREREENRAVQETFE